MGAACVKDFFAGVTKEWRQRIAAVACTNPRMTPEVFPYLTVHSASRSDLCGTVRI